MNFYFKISIVACMFIFVSGCSSYKENKLGTGEKSSQEKTLEARNLQNVNSGGVFHLVKLYFSPPVQATKLAQCVSTTESYGATSGSILVGFSPDIKKSTEINKLLELLGTSERVPADKSLSDLGWFWKQDWKGVTLEEFVPGAKVTKNISELALKILDENKVVRQVYPGSHPDSYKNHIGIAALHIKLATFVTPEEFKKLMSKYGLEALEIKPVNDYVPYQFIFDIQQLDQEKAWLCYFRIFHKNLITDASLDEEVGSF